MLTTLLEVVISDRIRVRTCQNSVKQTSLPCWQLECFLDCFPFSSAKTATTTTTATTATPLAAVPILPLPLLLLHQNKMHQCLHNHILCLCESRCINHLTLPLKLPRDFSPQMYPLADSCGARRKTTNRNSAALPKSTKKYGDCPAIVVVFDVNLCCWNCLSATMIAGEFY